jgi:hypothetical protein
MTALFPAREPVAPFADDKAGGVRVNARLDAEHADKLRRLMAARGCGITDALKFAIDCGNSEIEGVRSSGRKLLDSLIGAFDGRPETPADLSEHYKRYLDRSLGLEYLATQDGASGARPDGHRG